MYAYQPSEGLLLGTALAAWSNALDPQHADVQWFLRKWEAQLTLNDGTSSVRHIHALFMRLRRDVAASISTDLVEHMDLLIESDAWQQPALARWQLCTGYFAEKNRPPSPMVPLGEFRSLGLEPMSRERPVTVSAA